MLTRLQNASTWFAKSRVRAYALAVLSTGVAFAIRLALDPILVTRPAYSLFAFAVLVTAIFAGTRPALLTTALSAAVVETFLYNEGQTAAVLTRDILEIALFVAVALGMLALNETVYGARKAQAALTDQLRHEEATQRAILATVPDAMIVIDEKGEVQSFSSTAQQLFGYTAAEVIGQNVKILMPNRPGQEDEITRYIKTRADRTAGGSRAVTARQKDGATFPAELAIGEARMGEQQRFVCFLRDLTSKVESERRMQTLQNELLHVSRLTAMGEMAAALAHELNQPLTAIANYSKAARRTMSMPGGKLEDVQVMMEKAASQSIRAGQIIRRLRDFVEHREVTRAVEDPIKVVEEAMSLGLIDIAHSGVKVHSDFDRSAPTIYIDKIQIQQVLLNLMRNAIEAMQTVEDRELRLRVERGDANSTTIAVCDTGPGLSQEVVSRLFQPFVTTKKTGMGVGLSICQSIVESHQGRIWASPNDGPGVTFFVNLPAAANVQPALS